MPTVQHEQPHGHSPTFKWTLTTGDKGTLLPLPMGAKVLVQVSGECNGGEVVIDGGLLDRHLTTLKVFVSEGIAQLPPVRYVSASFDGATAGTTVTVIVAVAP